MSTSQNNSDPVVVIIHDILDRMRGGMESTAAITAAIVCALDEGELLVRRTYG